MFKKPENLDTRIKPFEFYTARELWTNPHISRQMLACHLNENIDLASRNSTFINKSVEWITQHFHLDLNSSIVDFGCAIGHYTSRLRKTGAAVTGIDFSASSIAYAEKTARKEHVKIHYICKDYLEVDLKDKYDLIIMIMCDFAVLSPGQRTSLLNKFASILKQGGKVLLDVQSYAAFLNVRSKLYMKKIC